MKPSPSFPSPSLDRYLQFTDGDLMVTCCPNAAHNLRESLVHAALISAMTDVDRIVYINLPFSERRVTVTAKECFPEYDKVKHFFRFTVAAGDLYRYGSQIESLFVSCRKGVLIINAWEFASRGYREQQQLLFFLQKLRNVYPVTIFIYSHANAEHAKLGAMHRGGLGKLAIVAEKIYSVHPQEEEAHGAIEQMPVEIILREIRETMPAENEADDVVSAQLSSRNSNELDTHLSENTGSREDGESMPEESYHPLTFKEVLEHLGNRERSLEVASRNSLEFVN